MVEIRLGASFTADNGGIERGVGGLVNYWVRLSLFSSSTLERVHELIRVHNVDRITSKLILLTFKSATNALVT